LVIVYAAGHGAVDKGQTEFVCNKANTEDKNHYFPLEAQLRNFSKMCKTTVIAFYDVCKTPKPKAQITDEGRGGDGELYRYSHVGTQMNTKMSLKSSLATDLINCLNVEANEGGLIQVP